MNLLALVNHGRFPLRSFLGAVGFLDLLPAQLSEELQIVPSALRAKVNGLLMFVAATHLAALGNSISLAQSARASI